MKNPDQKHYRTKSARNLIYEYLGTNVAINSVKEGEELVCDLRSVIAAENFTSIYSNEQTKFSYRSGEIGMEATDRPDRVID